MHGTQERGKVEVAAQAFSDRWITHRFFRSKLISQKSLKMNECKLEGEKLVTAWKAISGCKFVWDKWIGLIFQIIEVR